jgi:hypothetical protein
VNAVCGQNGPLFAFSKALDAVRIVSAANSGIKDSNYGSAIF